MAAKTKSSTSTTAQSPKGTPFRLPKGAARPTSCGQLFELSHDVTLAAEGCKRLPRHHGDHSEAKPRGLMTPAQRKAAVTKTAKPKPVGQLVTIGGTKFRATFGKDGEVLLTRVEPKAPVAEPTSKVTRSAKPKVRNLRAAKVERQVAAPRKVTRTVRPKADPTARQAVANA